MITLTHRIEQLKSEIQAELRTKKKYRNKARIARNREIIKRLQGWIRAYKMRKITEELKEASLLIKRSADNLKLELSKLPKHFPAGGIYSQLKDTHAADALAYAISPIGEQIINKTKQYEDEQAQAKKLSELLPTSCPEPKPSKQYFLTTPPTFISWHKVGTLQPRKGEKVLVVQDPTKSATREPLFAIFDGKDFIPPAPTYFADFQIARSVWSDIIYWMPLPTPPKS